MAGRTSLDLTEVVEDLRAAGTLPEDPDVRAWLERLVGALDHEAALSAWGRYLAREEIRRSARALAASRPKPGRVPVPGPGPRVAMVIAGLPRTGTTLLQTLFAASAVAWVPTTLTFDHPERIGGRVPADDDARAASAARIASFLRYARGFEAIHPMGPDLPEECDALAAHTFESFRYLVYHDVPSYRAAWLAGGHDGPYRYLAHVAGRRAAGAGSAVLKAPGHLHGYRALLEHLEPTIVVQVHRPVGTVLASWLSLVASARGVFAERVADTERLAEEWLGTFEAMVATAEPVVAAQPDRFVGVDYGDLCAQPVTVARRLADGAGIRLGPDELEAMERTAGRLRRRAPHRYPTSLPAATRARVAALDERSRALTPSGTVG